MRKLLLLCNLFAITLGALAQNDTTRYTMVNGYGFTYNRLKAKAALVMPTDTVANKLPGSLVVLNDTLYVRKANRWEPVTGGGVGIPAGGTTGQLLAKDSDTSYDVSWIDNFTTEVRETVKASTSINKGQAVYVSGADGTNVIVSKASNASEMTSSKTLGLLYQDLANNGIGYVVISGRLSGLNTSTATAGDPVWLGTNGNLLYGIANKPVAPAHMVYLGVVTRVNANNGEIFVHVQNGFEIEELHNVLITDSLNNQLLAYDSTTRLWKNRTIATVLGYTPVKTTDTASMLAPYLRDADTTAMLAPFARDTGVVHKTGTETIIGAKTFTQPIAVNTPALGSQLRFTSTGTYGVGVQAGQLQLIVPSTTQKISLGYGTSDAFTSILDARDADIVAYRKLRALNIIQSEIDSQNWADPSAAGGTGQIFSYFPNATNNFGQGIAAVAGTKYDAWYQVGAVNGGGFRFYRGTTELMRVTDSTKIASLAGSGTRMVVTNATGVLSAQAIPAGTVTSITAGTGLTGGTITSTGTIAADTAVLSTRAWRQKGIDSVATIASAKPGGTGTTNYVTKWTGTNTIGPSTIVDDGTGVGIGISPTANTKLYIRPNAATDAAIYSDNGVNTGFIVKYGSEPITNIGNDFNRPFGFLTNNTERMRIFANGRVGINTGATDAGYQLDVNGTFRTSGSAAAQMAINTTNASGAALIHQQSGSSVGWVGNGSSSVIGGSTSDYGINSQSALFFAIGGYRQATINSAGNFGIATASPEAKFVVADGTNYRLAMRQWSGTGMEINAWNDAYQPTIPLRLTANYLSFNTGSPNTEAMRIASNGNVVIGSGTTGYKLFVDGDAYVRTTYGQTWMRSQASGGDTTTLVNIRSNANRGATIAFTEEGVADRWTIGTRGGNSSLFFSTGSNTQTPRMTMTNGGNVLVGTTTTAANGLMQINGDLGFQGSRTVRLASNADGETLTYLGTRLAIGNINSIAYGYADGGQIASVSNVDAQLLFDAGRASGATISRFKVANTTSSNTSISLTKNAETTFFASTAGNVGIGTASPSFRLDVRSSVNDVAYLFSSAGGGSNLVFADANTVSAPKIGASGDQLFFTTNGTVQARINTSGNFLLGTTNNLARLTVQNSASTDVAHFSTTTAGAYTVFADGNTTIAPKIGALTNSIVFNTASTGSVTERMRIGADGNVGIGTQSPTERLVVTNVNRDPTSAEFTANIVSNSPFAANFGGSIGFTGATDVAGTTLVSFGAIQGVKSNATAGNTAGDMRILTRNSGGPITEKMRVTTDGNVGIGTASPSQKLDVNGISNFRGDIYVGVPSTTNGRAYYFNATNTGRGEIYYDGTNNVFRIESNYGGTGSYQPLTFWTSASERMRIFANGRIFMGASPSDAGYQLDVNGNTRVTGKIDVTANTSIGHNIIRTGTSDIAAQVFNSNGWLLYGAEGANGGAIFTGSTPYAAVAGSGYNRPLQLATNNTVRMEIDSTGLVGINTTSPTERLDVNGRARIRTVDSTATATNMLYVDNNGVIKKTAVPGTSVAYSTDVASIASGSGFTFVKDSATGTNHHFLNKIEDVNTGDATVTMQIAVYKTTSTFTTGAWQSVATIPGLYAPQTTVIYELPGYASGTTYYTSGSAQFSGAAEYTGTKVVRIDPSGNVEVRIGTVSASATQGGTNYVIIPIAVTWVVNPTPL